MLAGGMVGLGGLGLFSGGNAAGGVDWIVTTLPLLTFPLKFCVTFPLTYHFLAGCRHLVWDEKLTGLDLETAKNVSLIILGGSGIIGLYLATLSSCDEGDA